MIEPYRGDFNARFTDAKYAELLRVLEERVGTRIEFRVAETPCFFAQELLERMVQAGVELTEQLLGNAKYMEEARAATPAEWTVPNQDARPHFMTVDFGLVRDAEGELQPKLVEMQAFPSIFGYQPLLAKTYLDVFGLDKKLEFLFGGMDEAGYWKLMREVIVGEHEVENVVLMEVEPERQKTLPEILMTEKALGIKTLDVAKLVK